ncbi:MAG: hypothetical protein WBL88_03335 [Nitrososphaeraceae archaeon]
MSTDFYASKLAARRWQIYQKEQNEKRRYSYKDQNIIAALVWLIKLIIPILEKVQIKKKRTMEKILVE